MGQEQLRKQPERSSDEAIVEMPKSNGSSNVEVTDIDKILDDIDGILEENPQQLVDLNWQANGE